MTMWDDVEDHYVKWGTLFIKLKGSDEYHKKETMDLSVDEIDELLERAETEWQALKATAESLD